MLTARPKSMLSSAWEVYHDDTFLALLKPSLWSEKAQLHLPGAAAPLLIDREGWASGDFRLLQRGAVVVRARKPSAWKSAFVLDVGEQAIQFKPDSCFHSAFTLYQGGRPIGRIQRRGLFARRATIALPEDWPLALQVFVFWLAVLVWNRDSSAAT